MSELTKLGTCDKRQYEHAGPHQQIPEIGQGLPPFPCANWKSIDSSPVPEGPATLERDLPRAEDRRSIGRNYALPTSSTAVTQGEPERQMLDALIEAEDAVHGEYCGTTCVPTCRKITAAITVGKSLIEPPAQPSTVVQTPIHAQSKSEFRRMSLQGAPVVPVGETKRDGWIPVTERWPEFDVEVDVLIKGETRTTALRFYHDEGWCWSFITESDFNLNHKDWADFEMDDRDVTHWMPLPALPATEKEK